MAVFNQRVNPNTSVSKSLGFNPRGVVVQNYTPYWLYFPQADQFCPPWTDGWTAPLILNSNGYGYMQIQTPIGRTVQTNVTPNIAQFVNLQWTDSDVSYSEGTPGDSGSSVDPSDTTSGVSPVLSASGSNANVPVSTGATVTLLPLLTNGKRYQLLSWTVTRGGQSPSITTRLLDGILATSLLDSGANLIDTIILANSSPEYSQPLYGIYVPVGLGLQLQFGAFLCNQLFSFAVLRYLIV